MRIFDTPSFSCPCCAPPLLFFDAAIFVFKFVRSVVQACRFEGEGGWNFPETIGKIRPPFRTNQFRVHVRCRNFAMSTREISKSYSLY